MGAFIDLTGQRFGQLVVIQRGTTENKTTKWICQCDCGHQTTVNAGKLMSGHTRSCGHLRYDLPQHFKMEHGLTETSEFKSWSSMLTRCNNPKYHLKQDYSERGITVCDRWLSFKNFIDDMGMKPFQKASIERIDNDKGYYPENCKWASRIEQNRNKRSNIVIEHDGQKMVMAQWTEKYGINYHAFRYQFVTRKKSFEDAIKTCQANAN